MVKIWNIDGQFLLASNSIPSPLKFLHVIRQVCYNSLPQCSECDDYKGNIPLPTE